MIHVLLAAALASDLAEAHQVVLFGQDSPTEDEKLAQRLAFQAGWSSLVQGYPEQALATFRAGHGYPAAVGEAVVLTRMGQFDEAGLALQKLPADDEVLYLQAWVWTHQGEDQAAIALLAQIPPHSPLAAPAVGLTELVADLPTRRRHRAKGLAGLAPLELHLRIDGEQLVPYVDGW